MEGRSIKEQNKLKRQAERDAIRGAKRAGRDQGREEALPELQRMAAEREKARVINKNTPLSEKLGKLGNSLLKAIPAPAPSQSGSSQQSSKKSKSKQSGSQGKPKKTQKQIDQEFNDSLGGLF